MTRIQADLAKDQVAHANQGAANQQQQDLEHRRVDVDIAKSAANLLGRGGNQ
jgi:hypothetical protein